MPLPATLAHTRHLVDRSSRFVSSILSYQQRYVYSTTTRNQTLGLEHGKRVSLKPIGESLETMRRLRKKAPTRPQRIPYQDPAARERSKERSIGVFEQSSRELGSQMSMKSAHSADTNLVRLFQRGDKEHILQACVDLDILTLSATQDFDKHQLLLKARVALAQYADKHMADAFVSMLKSGALLPNTRLNNVIMRFYMSTQEYSKVVRFAPWLVENDMASCDENTYAMSIIASAKLRTPRQKVEDLYASALSWTNDQFREYHFSPEATLDNHIPPTRLKSWKHGLPLLDAIAVARILGGDAKQAYKAIDTHYRLQPTFSAHQVIPTCMQYRPPTEVFVLHQALAYRHEAQSLAKPDTISLMRLLRRALEVSDDSHTVGFHGNLLRSMLVIVHSRGGLQDPTHALLHELVIGLACTANLVRDVPRGETETRLARIYILAKRILGYCTNPHERTMAIAYNKLLSQIGRLTKSNELTSRILYDMSELDVAPNSVTMRALLQNAWYSNNASRLTSAWTHLREHNEAAGNILTLADWNILAKACVDLGHIEFLRSEMADMTHTITPEIVTEIEVILRQPPTHSSANEVPTDIEKRAAIAKRRLAYFDELLTNLEADVGVLEGSAKCKTELSDTRPVQIAIGAHPSWQIWYDRTDQDVRRLFRQVTFGTSDGPVLDDPKLHDMHELRFRNWDAMNHVFALEEAHKELVRNEQTWSRLVSRDQLTGLSDFLDEHGKRRPVHNVDEKDVQIPAWLRKARDPKEILRLRDRTLPDI